MCMLLLGVILVAPGVIVASKQPRRLQMASEVANGLRIELIDLNYLHNSAFLASFCLYGLNERRLIMMP